MNQTLFVRFEVVALKKCLKRFLNNCHKIKPKAKSGHMWSHVANRGHSTENAKPVPSVGKHETGVKRGKTYSRYQASENMKPIPSAGKLATGTKRGKASARTQNHDLFPVDF